TREPHALAVESPAPPTSVRALFAAAAPAALFGVAASGPCVWVLHRYLRMLFVGTPFAIGFVAGFRIQRGADAGGAAARAASQLPLLMGAGALLVFALEGVVCLAMAYPIAAGLAALGALLGAGIARAHRLRPTHAISLLLALPASMGLEAAGPAAPERV